jgi:hypothetical protein
MAESRTSNISFHENNASKVVFLNECLDIVAQLLPMEAEDKMLGLCMSEALMSARKEASLCQARAWLPP